jgi:hypothetical protein
MFNVQRDEEIGIVTQIFTRPDVPTGSIAGWRMPQAVDRQNPFAHVPSDPDFHFRRRRDKVNAVPPAEILLHTRALAHVHG